MEMVRRKDMISRRLPCRLTEVESVDRCKELAGAVEEREESSQLHEAAKERTKELKEALAAREGRVTTISKVISSNTETRDVECCVILDYNQSRVLTQRTDTDAIVSIRPMNEEELQMEIYADGEEADPIALKAVVEDYFKRRSGEDDV